jgi:hypothetical protein
LSEKPLQAEPTESNKQAKEAAAEKGRRGKTNSKKGAKREKNRGEGAAGKGKRGGTETKASGK